VDTWRIGLKGPWGPADHQTRQRPSPFPAITRRELPAMDARTTPDRKSVIAARKDIETSTVEVKDELLTELLCRMYPLRVSQDS
jgi:hypothetical protein